MNRGRIRLVANSHIDPVWLWDKYEGIDETISTFRSACDRLDEYPDLKFSASSIILYKWVEQYAPDVWERIRRHVATGRWEITGGWIVESDCNLPTAASFYKSAELSRKYTQSNFGLQPVVAYSPDAFGHAATLPKILTECGFKYYVFMRPSAVEKTDLTDDLFYWEYQGHRVLCYRLKHAYTQGQVLNTNAIEAALADDDFVSRGLACFFFGVGNHGGGPAKEEVDYLLKRRAEIENRELVFSTCEEFFEEAEKCKDIPVYSGDLHMHAVGCYSVNRAMKQAIRSAERSLCYTERVISSAGQGTPENLGSLWEKTIFNQFHDIMPGSCSPDAAKHALDELGSVLISCRDTSYESLKDISSRMPVNCKQGEFRLYNSLDEPVTGPFEIESFNYYRPGSPFKDSSGKIVPAQEITPSVNCANRRWLFTDTIPARSMRSYYFDSEDKPRMGEQLSNRYREGSSVSLGSFEVSGPGTVSCSGKPLLCSPLSLQVIQDASDTWSHGVRGYGPSTGIFTPVSSAVCEGEIASFLSVKQTYGCSEADVAFRLYKNLPYFDMDIRVRWNEKMSLLKINVEPSIIANHITVQGPGGEIVKHTENLEEPLHGWIIAGELGIIQDGAFAYDRVGDAIRITLVRSNLYGYDISCPPDPLAAQNYTDIGEHSFRFRFLCGKDLSPGLMDACTRSFIEPFYVMREGDRPC